MPHSCQVCETQNYQHSTHPVPSEHRPEFHCHEVPLALALSSLVAPLWGVIIPNDRELQEPGITPDSQKKQTQRTSSGTRQRLLCNTYNSQTWIKIRAKGSTLGETKRWPVSNWTLVCLWVSTVGVIILGRSLEKAMFSTCSRLWIVAVEDLSLCRRDDVVLSPS